MNVAAGDDRAVVWAHDAGGAVNIETELGTALQTYLQSLPIDTAKYFDITLISRTSMHYKFLICFVEA
jgi:hypothetical protein